MRVLIQRVTSSSVKIDDKVHSSIDEGLLLFLGIEEEDNNDDIDWLTRKIVQLRIFSDEAGLMNRSILENGGMLLIISQFTLHAQVRKGNRPSFIRAARPETAIPLYESFCSSLRGLVGNDNVKTGVFGAYMQVSLVNDGPVTIWIDSKNK
jgi:D-tyrosyl-tRNA(Tyr) deacylase